MFNLGDDVDVFSDGKLVGFGIIKEVHKGFHFPYELTFFPLKKGEFLETFFTESELQYPQEEVDYENS